jgi:DNA-binding transcriptional LysR family regulator
MVRYPRTSIETLIAVVSAAEQHSIQRAGQLLGLSPSAVSKRIRSADEMVGSRLFRMAENGLCLTRCGETFYAEAIEALEHAFRAEEKTRSEILVRKKQLSIGHSTCLAPRLLRLLNTIRITDDPEVRIHHSSGLTMELKKKVLAGTLHAGAGFLPLSHPELLVRQIYEEPLVACIPVGHPLAARHTAPVQELVRSPWIAVAREPLPFAHEEIERCLHGYGISLKVIADAYSPWEAETYVAQKFGLCLLARSSALAHHGIVFKPVAARMLVRKSGIFVREDNRNPLLRKFIDLLLEATEPLRRAPFPSS